MRIVSFEPVLVVLSVGFLASPLHAVAADAIENSTTAQTNITTPSPPPDLVPQLPGQTTTPAAPPRIFPRPGLPAPAFARPIVEPQVTNQTRQALSFYGGYAARNTLSQQPRRTPIQAGPPRPMFRQTKPFQTLHRDPTVSPYLNLYRDEANTESAPNYFAFVRPQLDQNEANRMQQRDIQQIRGQLQTTSTVVGPQYNASGLPGTGTPARYMDTAQFYGGLRR